MTWEALRDRFLKEARLETAPWAGTHSLRKSFVTHVGRYVKDRRLGASLNTEMITRGDEGRVGLDETTYDLDPLIGENVEMLQAWEDMLRLPENLFGNSIGSVHWPFSAAGSSPLLADASSIDCDWLLPDDEKSLNGPPPPNSQTGSEKT